MSFQRKSATWSAQEGITDQPTHPRRHGIARLCALRALRVLNDALNNSSSINSSSNSNSSNSRAVVETALPVATTGRAGRRTFLIGTTRQDTLGAIARLQVSPPPGATQRPHRVVRHRGGTITICRPWRRRLAARALSLGTRFQPRL